ncbi:flagellar protein FliT [Bacillus norwichensis]|uniref:Flagellar protein FliT n=1 Tax=Bacillus norwichensis TaxID=2762217 RepID=A0ABR8VIP5_9BACI|nr:flagellar protein FliT [Bacillus norwichensis]MBD8004651.1 flagellar protein FliT [Bacillus norwichensis]
MSAVQECLAITKGLVDRVNNMGEVKREKIIGQVEEMLAKREELLPKIQPPFSSQERAAGKELLELNKELAFLLKELNKHIIRDLNAVDLKKTSAARYTNPYTKVQTDGVFYDKRQ